MGRVNTSSSPTSSTTVSRFGEHGAQVDLSRILLEARPDSLRGPAVTPRPWKRSGRAAFLALGIETSRPKYGRNHAARSATSRMGKWMLSYSLSQGQCTRKLRSLRSVDAGGRKDALLVFLLSKER